jgi:hypothetical protein
MYNEHFGGLPIDALMLVWFVLKHRKSNEKCDGTNAKKHRFDFGCCGQSWEKLDGMNAPKSEYGLQIFKDEANDSEVAAIKQVLAKALDAMQVCVDTVEMKELCNSKPYGCEEQTY